MKSFVCCVQKNTANKCIRPISLKQRGVAPSAPGNTLYRVSDQFDDYLARDKADKDKFYLVHKGGLVTKDVEIAGGVVQGNIVTSSQEKVGRSAQYDVIFTYIDK